MPFGAHINRYHAPGSSPSIVAHIESARHEAAESHGFDMRVVSLFVGGPRNQNITLKPGERAELREYLAANKIQAIAHSSYVAVPWGGNPASAQYIREEAAVCQESGICGLVVHLPKDGLDAVAMYAASLINEAAPGVRIYFETPAVTKSAYDSPAKLAALFARLRAEIDPDMKWFGLCVDTAHLWVSGVDLRTYANADAWMQGLEQVGDIIPPHTVMLHLNDSERERGKGPDAHAPLGGGKIWEGFADRLRESGLAAVVDYAERNGTPVVLERKPKEALGNDYRALCELAAGARIAAQ